MPSQSQLSFDPTPYLVERRGRKYLDVKWRLLWLRTEHPDAVTETQEVAAGEDWVKFRATVSAPGRGSATGHGMVSSKDSQTGWYEKAEAIALGRALVCLGYGTQFANEFDDDAEGTDAPAEAPIEFPRPGPRPVRETSPTPSRAEPSTGSRGRNGVNWTDFWSAVREYRRSHPQFDEASVVGREPSKRMTAEEAMRRFREAVTAKEGE